MTLSPALNITAWDDLIAECGRLIASATREHRVPVSWMLGPDIRAIASAKLDAFPGLSKAQQEMMMRGEMLPLLGLPCYPMSADGVALKTVAAQGETGDD